MSVYIPGMEMPAKCKDCVLVDDYQMQCPLMPGVVSMYKEFLDAIQENRRSKYCPLIPVPEHGDLIDRTAFRYEMDNHYPFDKATQSRHGVEDTLKSAILQMLLAAPTIVPADKEEK